VKRIYINDCQVEVETDLTWLRDKPCGIQDAFYAAMQDAQVNVCSNCGVIQDMPEYGGVLIEWAPDDSGEQLCLECYEK
jgi:hypothetical protein